MSAVIPSGKSSKDLQSQRTFVEQLRRELKVQRVKLSQCANELIQYCEQQGNVDPLVSPKAGHDNPFRNSGSKCVLFWEQAIADFVVLHTEYSFWHWTMVNYLQKARDGFWGRSSMLSCAFIRRLSWIRKQTSKRVLTTERRRKASIQSNSQKKLSYLMQRRDDFVTNASTSKPSSTFDSERLRIADTEEKMFSLHFKKYVLSSLINHMKIASRWFSSKVL